MKVFSLILVFVNFTFSQIYNCEEKFSAGKKCGTTDNSTVKYYFDNELSFCYPYKYLGCEESVNSFESEQSCLEFCKPADQVNCGGNVKPDDTCMGIEDKQCKPGNVCINGGMIGLCCNAKIQEQWDSEHSPKCVKSTEKIVEIKTWYGSAPLIGRKCTHNFCPTGSTCVQKKWTAHCCTKK
ncbi:unnamed protein product [Caenorhabditis angaria]|uniref:BPTI/Kunitz inhibitor domain-containing protein n=1 Tax=Caenorhabditis angaria TaxID=860376 RepID=A0A9P1J3E8_9PELO|nr:unnamed protein product [Caenorhabditis angaria]